MDLRPNFRIKYEKKCSLNDTIPLGGVLENLDEYSLDLNADKIGVYDWKPLIDTLGSDHSLKFVAVRSFYRFEISRNRASHLQPPIFDRALLHRLCAGLAACISKAKSLHCFILQGFPLEKRDVAILAQGLAENDSIQQLSLEGCTLGDSGIFKLVPVLRDKIDLFWLNVTSCGINERGAIRLCDLVQTQSILRSSAAWVDSLRYRQPSFGQMPGLRRLTMCNNSIGDRAALTFAERLKDDRWLRALDLQMCDLSSTSAIGFIEALELNRSLVIVDLRKNQFVEARLLQELKRALNRNVKVGIRDPLQISWRWLGERASASIGPGGNEILEVTAEAAAKNSNRSVRAYTCCKSGCSERRPRVRHSARSLSMHGRVPPRAVERQTADYSDDDEQDESVPARSHSHSPNRLCERNTADIDTAKQISQLRALLRREIEARRRVEHRLTALQLENSRLLSEVTSLRGSVTPTAGLIPDSALQEVEQTIAQFHSFLDYLKDKGMENLVRDGLSSTPQRQNESPNLATAGNEPPNNVDG